MKHEQYLKLISQELKEGKIVEVSSTNICRCGLKFSTDAQLQSHVMRPLFLRPQQPSNPKPKLGVQVPVSLTAGSDLMGLEPPIPEPLLREPKQPQPLPSLSSHEESGSTSDSFE